MRELGQRGSRLGNVDEVSDDLRINKLDADVGGQQDSEQNDPAFLRSQVFDQQRFVLGVSDFQGGSLSGALWMRSDAGRDARSAWLHDVTTVSISKVRPSREIADCKRQAPA